MPHDRANPGDRVRVEFEGVVDAMTMASGRTYIRTDGKAMPVIVYAEHCTVLPPLVKVGDVVDYDALEALSPASVVRDIDGDIGVKNRDDWSVAGFESRMPSIFFTQPVTVLWLPE